MVRHLEIGVAKSAILLSAFLLMQACTLSLINPEVSKTSSGGKSVKGYFSINNLSEGQEFGLLTMSAQVLSGDCEAPSAVVGKTTLSESDIKIVLESPVAGESSCVSGQW